MNRREFMEQLERMLQDISPEERAEALQYYNDYFDDAGAENEQSVIEALGTPEKVAENIKKDLFHNAYESTRYTGAAPEDRKLIKYQQTEEKTKQKNKMSSGMIALIVILCILASPVLLGILGGVLGIVIGIFAAWFGLILAFGGVSLSLFAAAVVLLIVGIICLPPSRLVGLALFGIAMVVCGLGILFMMLTVVMAGKATPAIFRGIASLFGNHKHEEVEV